MGAHRLHTTDAAVPTYELPDAMRGLLNRVRFQATTCRASARVDLWRACDLIGPDSAQTTRRLDVLLQVLDEALGKRPVFYCPGAADLSFDERWLIGAIDARMRDDDDSFAFLMHARVAKPERRLFAMLVTAIAACLNQEA